MAVPERVETLVHALLTGSGDLDPAVRRAMLDRSRALSLDDEPPAEVADEWLPYLDKVTRHAYKVVDGDVDRLRAAGWSDGAIFEATLSAATGAALARLERGLELLREDSSDAS